MNRKDFLKQIFTKGSIVALVPAALIACADDEPTADLPFEIDLSLSENDVLNEEFGFKIIKGIIVVNSGSDSFMALSSECTHKQCSVTYDKASNKFPCPCHGSVFDADGSVLNGPAESPLKKYSVSKLGKILTIGEIS